MAAPVNMRDIAAHATVSIATFSDPHNALELNWPVFSTVVLGLTPATQAFHRVTTDHDQSMLMTMEECLNPGYRRPGLAARLETIPEHPLAHPTLGRWNPGRTLRRIG